MCKYSEVLKILNSYNSILLPIMQILELGQCLVKGSGVNGQGTELQCLLRVKEDLS